MEKETFIVHFINEEKVLKKYKGRGKDVIIPDEVTVICNKAFDSRKSLRSVIIPNSVKVIGWAAFNLCTSLTSIEIPDSVTRIDAAAFCGCKNLQKIVIPQNVTEMFDTTFLDCKKLVICTSKGSYAEQYARKYHIPCVTENAEYQCPRCGHKFYVEPFNNRIIYCDSCHIGVCMNEPGFGSVFPCRVYLGSEEVGLITETEGIYQFDSDAFNIHIVLKEKNQDALDKVMNIMNELIVKKQ